MIQHMNLVFSADGLSVGEGAFLMACANHTDDRGYVVAHMQQLADEAHMSLRSARDQKARLEKRGLLKSASRFSPKNGAQIANLFRINLGLLKSMKRARTDYGPTLIEELTFDAPPEETTSSAPPAESAGGGRQISQGGRQISQGGAARSAGDGGAKSAALLPPSSSPSPLPRATCVSGDASGPAVDQGERESAPREELTTDEAAGAVPPQRAVIEDQAVRVVEAYAAAAGRPVLAGTRVGMERQARDLLAAGLPMGWLCDRAAELPARGWTDLARHAERSTVPVPGAARPAAAGVPAWCGRCGDGNPAARSNPRFRTDTGEPSGTPCPACHPEAAQTPA